MLKINFCCCIVGHTEVQAFSIPRQTFTSNGILTVGHASPGMTNISAFGIYVGEIDEIRIWSRPHNPSIIRDNFRIVVTASTSDIVNFWTLNEGTGFAAGDRNGSKNMLMDSVLHPPSWVKSDLRLSSSPHLNARKFTTEQEISDAIASAREKCNDLINTYGQKVANSSQVHMIGAYEKICTRELIASNQEKLIDTIVAGSSDIVLASARASAVNASVNPLSNLCKEFPYISNYIGASGRDCTPCVFGTVFDGQCLCFDTHWGNSCSSICPLSRYGACNSIGVCDTEKGICKCPPQVLGWNATVKAYWTSFVSTDFVIQKVDHLCNICTENWFGGDCHFALSKGNSTKVRVGIAFGSNIVILRGISFSIVTPGLYNYFRTGEISSQVLYLPCEGNPRCRYIKEFAIHSDDSVLLVSFISKTECAIYLDGQLLINENIKTFGKVTMKITSGRFVRLTFYFSSILVYNSTGGLVLLSRVDSNDGVTSQGLLGSTKGEWAADLGCHFLNGVESNALSGNLIGRCLKENYAIIDREKSLIRNGDFYLALTSGGYSIHLFNQELRFAGLPSKNLTEFTFSFWTKVSIIHIKVFTVLVIKTDDGEMKLTVNDGLLLFDWHNTYRTNLTLRTNTWCYISMSFSLENSVTIIAITTDNVQKHTLHGVRKKTTTTVSEFSFTASAYVSLDLDCSRLWSNQQSLNRVVEASQTYCDNESVDVSLLAAAAMDEGAGLNVGLSTYERSRLTGKLQGQISGKWLIRSNFFIHCTQILL